MTSPTTRAHFTYGRLYTVVQFVHAEQHAACTGFKPSRTSGSARPTITLIA
jgi:hypothetical protein